MDSSQDNDIFNARLAIFAETVEEVRHYYTYIAYTNSLIYA